MYIIIWLLRDPKPWLLKRGDCLSVLIHFQGRGGNYQNRFRPLLKKDLFKKIDPFAVGTWCAGMQTGSHKVVSSAKKKKKYKNSRKSSNVSHHENIPI